MKVKYLVNNHEIRYWRADWFSDQFEICKPQEWNVISTALQKLGVEVEEHIEE